VVDLSDLFAGLGNYLLWLTDFLLDLWPKLLYGAWISIVLMIISGIVGNLLAVPVALARYSRNPLLWIPSYLFILLMRGTPLLVQIYILYYGLGAFLGQIPSVRYSFLWPYLREGFWYAAVALSINTAGYSGFILRGAMLAVPHGEIEAGRAFGMSKQQIMFRIILPRAIRISLPTFSGETILLLKATSLASTVTVTDLMRVTGEAYAASFRFDECYISAGVIYVALSYLLTRCFYFAERQLNKDRLQPRPVGISAVEPMSAIERPVVGTAAEK
jgi:His/Glu/Gln/Arg/opine family amino acid ABC transporter permease subunit